MSDDKRTLRAVYDELFAAPWFTALFGAETVKTFVETGYEPTTLVIQYAVLTLAATGIWVLSDAVDVRKDVIGE